MEIRDRPSKRFFFMALNLTIPTVKENNVSSAARLTFSPGKNFVPRWRIKIEPALALSPANSFTPSLLDIESRPSFVEPEAFVLDMLVVAHELRE